MGGRVRFGIGLALLAGASLPVLPACGGTSTKSASMTGGGSDSLGAEAGKAGDVSPHTGGSQAMSNGGASAGSTLLPQAGTATSAGAGGAASSVCEPTAEEFPDNFRVCVTDEDCVALEWPTCGGCLPVAVNKGHEASLKEAGASFDASVCPDPDCEAHVCPEWPVVACETARCVLKTACSERTQQTCLGDSKCHPYTAKLCSEGGSPKFLTCGPSSDQACTDDSMCYLSPGGEPTLFPTSCAPPGYEPCATSQCPK